MQKQSHDRQAFTLIELLLVIGIIAVLAAIVIVAINPTKMLGDARDAQRNSDINTILNAIGQYVIDNGDFPCAPGGSPCVDSTWRMLGTQTTGCDEDITCGLSGMATACLSLRVLSGTYITTVPSDPRYGSGDAFASNAKTMYAVSAQNGRASVKSCTPENMTGAVVSR